MTNQNTDLALALDALNVSLRLLDAMQEAIMLMGLAASSRDQYACTIAAEALRDVDAIEAEHEAAMERLYAGMSNAA